MSWCHSHGYITTSCIDVSSNNSMIDEKNLMKAIVELREQMRLSQSVFAVDVLEKTLPTQQRYETVKPPPGDVLAQLVHVAREQKRPDLADIFKEAAIASVAPSIQDLILEDSRHGKQPTKTTPEGVFDHRRARSR